MAIMEQTPLPISLDAARKLPWEPGRSAEVFVDGEIEVRFTPQPKDGTPHTHDRDEPIATIGLAAAITGQVKLPTDVAGTNLVMTFATTNLSRIYL
jgi:hypothetical protein